jgi:hypothetical protein
MRIVLAAIILVLISGCEAQDSPADNRQQRIAGGVDDYSYKPDPARKYPPVTDPAAPTVAALKAQGLEQSGWDAEPFACGPSCDAEYTYAIFLGRRAQLPTPAEHRYTCPNPETPGEQEGWRCMPFSGSLNDSNGG